MLNGAPVTRNFLIGFGVSSVIAIQMAGWVKSALGVFSALFVTNPNEAIETAILIYQMQNIERIIGSDKFFTRLFYTTIASRLVIIRVIIRVVQAGK